MAESIIPSQPPTQPSGAGLTPQSEDEILIKTKEGEFKVLKGGQIIVLKEEGPGGLPAFRSSEPPQRSDEISPAPLSGVRTVPSTTSAPFYFHLEDEEEIKKIKNLGLKAGFINYENEAEQILQKSSLQLREELTRRFKNIIITCLRDIRDVLETRETLVRSVEKGGLGLSEAVAQEVLEILRRRKGQLLERGVPEVKKKALAPPKAPLAKAVPQASVPSLSPPPLIQKPSLKFKPEEKIKSPLQPTKIAPPPPRVIHPLSKIPAVRPPRSAPIPPTQIPQVEKKPLRPLIRRPLPQAPRPKLEDIKFSPKLLSPVEELRSLTLVDFRRLGTTPQEATEKIKKKIQLLEEESFTQRTLAIKAWQESEVNKLYLALGQESLREKKPVSGVVQQRLSRGQPSLSEQEFQALLNLNKSIRF